MIKGKMYKVSGKGYKLCSKGNILEFRFGDFYCEHKQGSPLYTMILHTIDYKEKSK